MQDALAKPCFEFADSALHIRIPRMELRLRWAPAPRAEEKNWRGDWKECWPTFRILRPLSDHNHPPFELDVEGDNKVTKHLEQKQQAFNAFRSTIPAELAASVERFGSHQWTLLKLLHEEQAAVDLARSNLVLVYCLANNAEFRGTVPEAAAFQAVRYSHAKQRVTARWLGFPDGEAVVRLLRKIQPEAVYPSRMHRLCLALQNDSRARELLAHYDHINAGMLELAMNQNLRPVVTTDLFGEVAGNPGDMAAADTADLLLNALSILWKIAPGRAIRALARIAQVREFSRAADDEYAEYKRRLGADGINATAARSSTARRAVDAARPSTVRRAVAVTRPSIARRTAAATGPTVALTAAEWDRIEAELDTAAAGTATVQTATEWDRIAAALERRGKGRQPGGCPFPPPPIRGTKEIIPLASEADLCAEGMAQQNCVASYAGRVKRGGIYIYRVMYPERATLSIARGPDGCWRRDELKKAENHPVRQSTKIFVDQWLGQSGGSARRPLAVRALQGEGNEM